MCENMSYLCRLCLKDSEFRFSLFTGDVVQKIESLTSIKITIDDKLPQTCCESCVANVYTSYKFQQCIIDSDKILREKLFLNESHIIEQAKQAPDLFEILHVDGSAYSNNVELLEVKPKIEDICDENIHGFDCKDEQVETEHVKNGSKILKKLLQSSDCLVNDCLELYDRSDVEYINVANFVDTINTLETQNNGSDIYSLDIKDKSELNTEAGQESFHINPTECVDDSETNVVCKELDMRKKHKSKSNILRENQKIDEDLDISSPEEVLRTLGIESKFVQKFTAYREKQKVNQTNLNCTECDQKFETKRMLQRHMLKHKIERCPFCDITMRSDNLKRHIQIHTDTPEVCEICGKIAKNKESLRGHINYQHRNTETVKCETCNREFKSNHHYKAHIRKVHLGIKNHQCHICGKKFYANHELKKHINMTHAGARPYVCQYCKKGFSSPYARKTHIRQHTLETPYRCEICTTGFRQKVSLVTHLKSKHKIVTKKGADSEEKDNF